MKRKLMFVVTVLFLTDLIYSQNFGLTEEELTLYRVTIYAEKEQIPLDRLITLEGRLFNSAVLKDKYVLINMGTTWCPFCNGEKPSVENLHNEFIGENFMVLAIFLGEGLDTVREYMREHEFSFTAIVDFSDRLRNEYAPRIPTSYLIDTDGNIVARINGNKNWYCDFAVRQIGELVR